MLVSQRFKTALFIYVMFPFVLGRRLSDIRGNQNIVSVKSLIKTIEGQGSLGSSTGSSRRGSSDSLGSPTNSTLAFSNHIDTTRSSPERRTGNHNNNNDSVPLRSALKKPKDADDKGGGHDPTGRQLDIARDGAGRLPIGDHRAEGVVRGDPAAQCGRAASRTCGHPEPRPGRDDHRRSPPDPRRAA